MRLAAPEHRRVSLHVVVPAPRAPEFDGSRDDDCATTRSDVSYGASLTQSLSLSVPGRWGRGLGIGRSLSDATEPY